MGTFCLTDFRVRQFDTIVWKGLGLDRPPELRDSISAIATGGCIWRRPTMQTSTGRWRLGLAYHRRLTGYGGFATFLQGAGTA